MKEDGNLRYSLKRTSLEINNKDTKENLPMNLTEFLMNSHQYDIQEVVDNSVTKLKQQRRKEREQYLKDRAKKQREQSIERYKKARTQYQLEREKLGEFGQKYKVKPSLKDKAISRLGKEGERLKQIDVTDPVQLGRTGATKLANLPTYLAGKALTKASEKLSGSTLSPQEYERRRREILDKEAETRYKMDKAERKAMVRKRVPNPEHELQRKKEKQSTQQKKSGPSKSEMEKMTPQQLAALASEGEPTTQQKPKTTTTKSPSTTPSTTTQTTPPKTTQQTSQQQSPSLQQRKERSYGSRSYAGDPYGPRAASRIRSGKQYMDPDISFDRPGYRLGRPTLPVKSQTTPQTQPQQTQQPQVTQTQTQQPTRSLSDRRKFTANIKPNQFFQSTMAGAGKPVNRPKPQTQTQTTQPTMNQPEPTKKPSRSLPTARQRPLPAQRLVGRKSRIAPTQTNSDQSGFGDN